MFFSLKKVSSVKMALEYPCQFQALHRAPLEADAVISVACLLPGWFLYIYVYAQEEIKPVCSHTFVNSITSYMLLCNLHFYSVTWLAAYF